MDPLRLTAVGHTRHSITMAWMAFREPGVTYRLQIKDRVQGWLTKYWGQKTQMEVGGLGAEECYHFRVGVIPPGDDCPPVWSKTVPANTKDDLIIVASLYRCVQYGNVNAVRKFINSRPYAVDSYNQMGQPALALSTLPQISTLLLNSGATNDLPSRFTGRTALMQAAAQGLVDVATLLLERGAAWHTQDRVGCTAVHYAVDCSQLAVVELAVSSGADLDIVDSCGWSPLTRGVVLGSELKVLSCLVNAGAEVMRPDFHGQTCLLLAILAHRHDVVKLLLQVGAGAAGDSLQCLTDIAVAHGDTEIESLLKSYFQSRSESKREGKTTPALHISSPS